MQAARKRAQREGSPEVDTTTSAPYPFDSSVVFICIDIEVFEGSRNIVTEVGVSTLDTQDIIGVAPGPGGSNWAHRVRARHFRVRENAGYVNSHYVTGCPDRFEKEFGQSEWISNKDIPVTVASFFKFTPNPRILAHLEDSASLELCNQDPPRNVVFLGHDVHSDIEFLRNVGFNIKGVSNIIEVLDTANLFRALKHETQPASLATVLQDLEIDAWNLHNAVSTR